MLRKTLRAFLCAVLLVALSSSLFASQGIVKRSSNLRPTPSSAKKPLQKLAVSDEVEILDETPQNGYYHVRTEDGTEGWVWGKALRLVEEEKKVLSFAATPSAQPETAISETWEKPAPNKTTFKGADGDCPWNGDGGDPDTFVRKNRSDVPTAYHDVKWEAIHDLPFPKDKPLRKNWSPEHIGEIGQYEGAAVRAIGYIVAVKPQGGNEEGTNCRFSKVSETDIHIAIVGEAGDGERDSVVVETTPRFLKAHPKWTKATLVQYANQDIPVRISGWLMLDPDHRAHLNKYRHTLWEIHPITAIEVLDSGQWKSIDTQ
jgi:hypothetical protein